MISSGRGPVNIRSSHDMNDCMKMPSFMPSCGPFKRRCKICKCLNPGFLQDGSTAGELRTFPASLPSVFYAAVKRFAGFSARAAAAAAARTKNIFAAHTAGKPAVCNALFSFHEYTSSVYLKLILHTNGLRVLKITLLMVLMQDINRH